jgi:glycine hydroxymethyltransferase
MKDGLKLVTNGTDNHMLLVDLTPYGDGMGLYAQESLDLAGIVVNKNTIPKEPSSPFYPSGIRLGTPALTTRGMKEQEMRLVGDLIAQVVSEIKGYEMPKGKDGRAEAIRGFRAGLAKSVVVREVKAKSLELCRRFPLYPDSL